MGIALALGKFDALHRGHHQLIRRAQQFDHGRYGSALQILSMPGMAKVLGWPPRAPLLTGPRGPRY